jgi:hypothetical protein
MHRTICVMWIALVAVSGQGRGKVGKRGESGGGRGERDREERGEKRGERETEGSGEKRGESGTPRRGTVACTTGFPCLEFFLTWC